MSIKEYAIPKEYKKDIDKKFCKKMLQELHIIFKVSLEDFDYECFSYLEGTGGWYESFATTCRELKKDKLLIYYNSLEWYDSDLFDAELTECMVNNKLILPKSEIEEVARQNNISADKIVYCEECGKYVDKKDAIYNKKIFKMYYCQNCETSKKYELDKKKAIKEWLKLNNSDYFICEKCKKANLIYNKGKKFCKSCEKGNSNYYKEQIDQNKKYAMNLKNKKEK